MKLMISIFFSIFLSSTYSSFAARQSARYSIVDETFDSGGQISANSTIEFDTSIGVDGAGRSLEDPGKRDRGIETASGSDRAVIGGEYGSEEGWGLGEGGVGHVFVCARKERNALGRHYERSHAE